MLIAFVHDMVENRWLYYVYPGSQVLVAVEVLEGCTEVNLRNSACLE